nr:phage related protein [uncultured Mediterranean phage uvMED]
MEINKFHALQLFTDTFAAETVHLTNEAIGIYIRLLCFAWTKNTKPFTTQSAYRICQCKTDDCHIQVYEVLQEFFKLEHQHNNRNLNTWTQKRLVAEHKYLSNKYKHRSEAGRKGGLAKRDLATSKNEAPIPSPKPIPNKDKYDPQFEQAWQDLSKKRGSKYKAHEIWLKLWSKGVLKETDFPMLISNYNSQIREIEDPKFIPHFSTWLSQRRWEVSEDEEKVRDIIARLQKLGYVHYSTDGTFERFSKDGKYYKIDRLDEKHQIQLEQ